MLRNARKSACSAYVMGLWRKSRTESCAGAHAQDRKRGLLHRLPFKWRALLLVAALGTISTGAIVAAAFVHYTIRFPDPMAIRRDSSTPVVRVLARDGSVLSERGQAHAFVPLDLLPRHVVDAVVATEDRRFFEHVGLDPMGILRAVFANIRAGRTVQGGSTLSQQLAKNLFLSPDRTFGRKAEELLLALWLEMRLPKTDILELYLNRVYFGGGAYGIEAAARRYFDKPASQLKLSEAAVLAGLLKAPTKYSPHASPGLARSRARLVLKRMLAAGYIGDEAEVAAGRDSVRFAEPNSGRDVTGLEYAVDFVLERLPPIVGTGPREIVVETTIDPGLQKRAQAIVEAALATEGAKASAGQAAVVVLDRDGEIRSMVGGRNWMQSQFNRAVKARRQPGSAFKPFVYLAAIERGARPEMTIVDAPITVGGWSPRNEDGRHRGTITLQHALAHSVNTVAVRLQQDTGTQRVAAVARRLGIKSELRQDLSLALGTSEVSLLELTGAYAVLASGGHSVTPHMIRRVRTASTILYQRAASERPRVVSPEHVGLMSSMLRTALVSGTGRRAALQHHAAAGKTGTSQDYRDAWFLGYTAHLAAGVWVGNDNGESMGRVMGGGLPATIWKAVMQSAHEGLTPEPLPGVAADTGTPEGESASNLAPELPGGPGRIAEEFRARPQRAVPLSARRAAQQDGRMPMAPSHSIDGSIFEEALNEPLTAPETERPVPSASTSTFNFGSFLRSFDLRAQPHIMGLVVRPSEASAQRSTP